MRAVEIKEMIAWKPSLKMDEEPRLVSKMEIGRILDEQTGLITSYKKIYTGRIRPEGRVHIPYIMILERPIESATYLFEFTIDIERYCREENKWETVTHSDRVLSRRVELNTNNDGLGFKR
jgi:hypothetical protein